MNSNLKSVIRRVAFTLIITYICLQIFKELFSLLLLIGIFYLIFQCLRRLKDKSNN